MSTSNTRGIRHFDRVTIGRNGVAIVKVEHPEYDGVFLAVVNRAGCIMHTPDDWESALTHARNLDAHEAGAAKAGKAQHGRIPSYDAFVKPGPVRTPATSIARACGWDGSLAAEACRPAADAFAEAIEAERRERRAERQMEQGREAAWARPFGG